MRETQWRNHIKWTPFLLSFFLLLLSLFATRAQETQAATVWVTPGVNDILVENNWISSSGKAVQEWGLARKREGSEGGTPLWCIQLGVPLNDGSNTGFSGRNVTDAQHKHISVIAYYGYYARGTSGANTKGSNTEYNEMFTQWRIWEYLGDRQTSIANASIKQRYQTWKNDTDAKVAAYEKMPSFASSTVKVNAGSSVTLTDTNKSLATYATTAASLPSGVTATVSGNTLRINAARNAVSAGSSIVFKNNIPASYQGVALIYSKPSYQSVIKPKIDPVNKMYAVKVEVQHYGKLQVTKNDILTGALPQNGRSFSGAEFKLTNTTTGTTETMVTDGNGVATSKEHLIGNTYSLVETKAPEGYQLNATPITGTFTHQSGDNTWSDASLLNKVTYLDTIIPDQVLLQKTSEDGKNLAGVKFVLADSLDNMKAGKYLRIDGNNKVLFPSETGYAAGKDYEVISGTDGLVKWDNIFKPASKKDRNYYYKEISTDSKHQLDTHVHLVTAEDKGTNNPVKVINKEKINLPETGSNEVAKVITIVLIGLFGVGVSTIFGSKLKKND